MTPDTLRADTLHSEPSRSGTVSAAADGAPADSAFPTSASADPASTDAALPATTISSRPSAEPLESVPHGPFGRLCARVLGWSRHRHAERYLAGLTFAESSVFPIPPESMLIPMTLARPEKALRHAAIATVASVVGGLYGYALGHYGATFVEPLIRHLGYGHGFATVLDWFERWGFWAVLAAGFTPVPYKLFTLGAGLLGLGLLPFAFASLIGRGARFFLVCVLIAQAGPRLAPIVERRIERVGWSLVVLLCLAALWLAFGTRA